MINTQQRDRYTYFMPLFFEWKRKRFKLIKKHITKNSLALSLKPTTDHKNLLGQNVNMVKNKIKVILNL